MASTLKRLSISVDHKTTIAETVREKDGAGSPIDLSNTESVSEKQAGGNPFADPEVAKFYRELYESTQYECRHEFDPDFEWTEAEEKAVIRKLDWRVSGFACVMFFALNVDRKNLGSAVSDNMLPQLHMTTNDYNFGNTIFLASFLLAELPSQLISKRIGPDRWIPMQMTAWSIVACSQFWLTGRSTFFLTRSLLGILEGGFIPDLILWLSYFYKSSELPIRLSWFWTSLNVTAIVIALLAYGLIHLDGHLGYAGWRWLFLIEGLITLCVGIAAWFLMPASAVETKTWYRPNGWFNDREVKIVVNRVLRDDPSKGDMHNRMGITPGRLLAALADYHLWPLYIIGLLSYIPQSPPGTYLTLSLRQIGFNPFTTNLLTIPATVIGCFTLLLLTWISVRVNERALIGMIQNIWTLPCIIALRVWTGAGTKAHAWPTFSLLTVLLSYPYCHAIVTAWVSRNSGSVRTRSVSAALYNISVQLGNIISANIYRADDAPKYHRGNSVLIAINVLVLFCFLGAKGYYILQNKAREKKWQALSEEERREYVNHSTDEGNKRLDFRFAH